MARDGTSLIAQMVESVCNTRDLGSIPGSGSFLGEGNGNHSGILVWKIPWMEESGGLHTMG